MFKVGDIVTGNSKNMYAITNSNGTFEVVGVSDGFISVKVIIHAYHTHKINTIFNKVFSEWFVLVETACDDPKEKVLKKIAHLYNLFENRKNGK